MDVQRVVVSAIAAMSVATAAQAAQTCDPGGAFCTYYIPAQKLPRVDAQQTLVWCWAATAQTIFRYYGHEVPQADIVAKAFGAVIPSTGAPDAMLRMLNASYTDQKGVTFSVSTPRYFDGYGLMPGNLMALGMQPGLTNQEVFAELAAEHPVFYSDGPHVMALVAGQSFRGAPVSGWALDPAPAIPAFYGPMVMPGVPAIGLRQLNANEMRGFFMAKVVVN